MPQNWPSNQCYQSDIVECNHNQDSNMPCAGLNGCHLQRFVIVPTMVPFGGLIKTVVPPGGNILFVSTDFCKKYNLSRVLYTY